MPSIRLPGGISNASANSKSLGTENELVPSFILIDLLQRHTDALGQLELSSALASYAA